MNSLKKRVLITGAVLSSSLESIETYNQLVSFLDDKYVVSSPLDTMNFEGNDKERYARAMDLLHQAEYVIAEMSTPSTGQGMEIQEAINHHIPILVLAKEGSKISGLIKGAKGISKIVYYHYIKETQEEIVHFIQNSNVENS